MKRLLNLLATTTWRRLIIYCVSFVIVFVTSVTLDLACGQEEDPYDYHLNFFHNNLQGSKGFNSFYYTNWPLLYDNSEPVDESLVNAKEWANYLGGGVTVHDAQIGLYGSGDVPDAEIKKIYKKAHNATGGEKSNSFFVALASPKNAALRKYFHFAKTVEPIADFKTNKWDDVQADVPELEKAANKAFSSALSEKNTFVKLRYLYQAQRMLHYSQNYEQAAEIYDKYIAGYHSKSHIKGWSLALKAGEERWLGDTVSAAYHFCQVFASCPEKRVLAYRNYVYVKAPAKAVFKMAANNRERAYIAAIDGFNKPGTAIKPLQTVYRYDPESPMVGVLLIREINKLEDYYLTPKLSNKLPQRPYRLFSFGDENKSDKFYKQHINNLKAFCETLSADGKYPEAGLGSLVSAYLCWMENKTQDGITALNDLANLKLSTKLDGQRHLLKLMLAAQSLKSINKVNQDSLLGELQWLDNKIASEKRKRKAPGNIWAEDYIPPFAASARDFYQFVLTPAYLKQHDTLMAALTILKSELPVQNDAPPYSSPWRSQMLDFWSYYLNSGHLKKIINMKNHRPDDPYLRLLTVKLGRIPNSDLYDLLGTAYMREHKYQNAIYALQKMKRYKNPVLGHSYAIDGGDIANPFVDNLNDYPKTYHQPGSKDYNRLDFAKTMVKLEKRIKSNPKNAAFDYYKMAVGLYNTSFSGNASYLISYFWGCYEPARRKRYIYDSDYLRSATAERYFLKAGEASTNNEYKAKCIFMAAKCRQKQVRVPDDFGYADDKQYLRAVRMNSYFKVLQKKYAATNFFQIASYECSYLKDYLASTSTAKTTHHQAK